jgi:hypothetical protein
MSRCGLARADEATTEDEKTMVELRRTLLESFATYDALAKRIRGLPCAKGSSQERLQIGIGVRAGGWLAKEMTAVEVRLFDSSVSFDGRPRLTYCRSFLLEQKSLTRQRKKHTKNASLSPSVVTAAPSDDGSSTHKPDSDLATMIQPLLEQVRLARAELSRLPALTRVTDVWCCPDLR